MYICMYVWHGMGSVSTYLLTWLCMTVYVCMYGCSQPTHLHHIYSTYIIYHNIFLFLLCMYVSTGSSGIQSGFSVGEAISYIVLYVRYPPSYHTLSLIILFLLELHGIHVQNIYNIFLY